MSNRIMALCWQLSGMSGTEKAVLIALADRADDAGMCWPSIATLAQMTCFTDRAVQKCIHSLLEKGLISVQVSPGGKSNKYAINPEPRSPSAEKLANANGERNSPLDGEPRSPRTKFTPNHVHRNGEPRSPNGEPRSPKPSRTIREPSTKSIAPPEGVDQKLWADFLVIRKAKKAPVTDTAIAGIRREAEKAGVDFGTAIATCCERGWAGYKAEWVKSDRLGVNRTATPVAPMATKNYREGITEDGCIH